MDIREANLSGGTHVVILGAGASIASNKQDREAHGMELPSMNNLPDVVGLDDLLNLFPNEWIDKNNFEATYSKIAENDPQQSVFEGNE